MKFQKKSHQLTSQVTVLLFFLFTFLTAFQNCGDVSSGAFSSFGSNNGTSTASDTRHRDNDTEFVQPMPGCDVMIATAADLSKIEEIKHKQFCLKNDIVLSAGFVGGINLISKEFNGRGFAIKGFKLGTGGVFKSISRSKITHLIIDSPTINMSAESPDPVGLLADKVMGSEITGIVIRNLTAVTPLLSAGACGLIAGHASSESSLQDVWIEFTSVDMKCKRDMGGAVGNINATEVHNVSVTGNLNFYPAEDTSQSFGGIFGYFRTGGGSTIPAHLSGLHYRGNLKNFGSANNGKALGGLIGKIMAWTGDLDITSSSVQATLTTAGARYAGGAIGYIWKLNNTTTKLQKLRVAAALSMDQPLTSAATGGLIGYGRWSNFPNNLFLNFVEVDADMDFNLSSLTKAGGLFGELADKSDPDINKVLVRGQMVINGGKAFAAGVVGQQIEGHLKISNSSINYSLKGLTEGPDSLAGVGNARFKENELTLKNNVLNVVVEGPETSKVAAIYNNYSTTIPADLVPVSIGNGQISTSYGESVQLEIPEIALAGNVRPLRVAGDKVFVEGSACELNTQMPVAVLLSIGTSWDTRESIGIAPTDSTSNAPLAGGCIDDGTKRFSFELPPAIREKRVGQIVFVEVHGPSHLKRLRLGDNTLRVP